MALTDKLWIVLREPDNSDISVYFGVAENILRSNQSLFYRPKAKVLDLACGHAGSWFVKMYGREFTETKVFNLDIEPWVIKMLKSQRRVVADAKRVPFSDDSFDIVWDGYAVFIQGIFRRRQ